ncbi:MAG: 3-hydroxyacyl-CoA dehydrogenase family protein [Candidatus Baldrarchaeia archaeon]
MGEISQVSIIGAGLMGHGIAQTCAQANCNVKLYDIKSGILENALKRIRSNLKLLAEERIIKHKDINKALSNINIVNKLEVCVKETDLVIEAVPEDLKLKRKVFSEVEKYCPEDTILATTTSVISIGDISEAIEKPERMVGTHWMNPPFILPLVEIIRGPQTSDSTVERIKEFLENKCKKKTIVCRDSPGFLVNRMAAAVLAEASKLVESGITNMEDIDKTWTEHLGLIYLLFGPFRNLDCIGLDIIYFASIYLSNALKDERFKPPNWLLNKVKRGQLGIKTGEGIYKYEKTFEEMYNQRIRSIIKILRILNKL